ncbi:MAG: caspase family protein [Deltaproteobacteria bacterium]|nr:caspase family protein [Deltaproteobacteria bacterium]
MYSKLIFLIGFVGLAACVSDSRPKGGLEPVHGLLPDAVDQALRPKRLALLVGIGEFEDERWPSLNHARNDAEKLGELLSDPVLGYFDKVEVLAEEGGTSLAQVNSALDRIADLTTNRRDTLVIYFSTHGTLARDPTGKLARYLVTSDTKQKRIRETALPVSDLIARFERMPSSRKLLILASCHSGSGKSALPEKLTEELKGIKGAFFVRPLSEISQASMVLAACAWGETAREDDKLEHDIYTNFLLDALDGQDQDGDGAVTATEAHAYAMARTYYYSKGKQRPQVESTVLGADPIVLSGRRIKAADPVLYSFLPQFEGLRVMVDGRDKGELPARIVLEPGRHKIVVSDVKASQPFLDEVVEVQPGDRIAIEDLFESKLAHWHLSARAGYQWFLDAHTRKNLVAPTPVCSLSMVRLDFPLIDFETGIDVSLGGGSQSLEIGGLSVSQDLLEIAYGLKMLYRFNLEPVYFLIGPRLAVVHLLRWLKTPFDKSQNYFNFSPGLIVQLRWKIWAELTLDIEARIHFFSVHTDDESLDLGYLDVFGGLGWGF